MRENHRHGAYNWQDLRNAWNDSRLYMEEDDKEGEKEEDENIRKFHENPEEYDGPAMIKI